MRGSARIAIEREEGTKTFDVPLWREFIETLRASR